MKAASPRTGYLVLAVALGVIAVGTYGALAAIPSGAEQAARSFVSAVNGGDWRAACGIYSHSYLKASRSECASLYRWGWKLYGPYDYRVVRRHMVRGRFHVELTRRGVAEFVDFHRKGDDWKVVAGGW